MQYSKHTEVVLEISCLSATMGKFTTIENPDYLSPLPVTHPEESCKVS